MEKRNPRLGLRFDSCNFNHLRIRVTHALLDGDLLVQLGEWEITKVGGIFGDMLDELSNGTIGVSGLRRRKIMSKTSKIQVVVEDIHSR